MTYDKSNAELVSVIIPTYNRMGTLERSVYSVLNQTYTNLELLIIDDGSDDGTEAYIKAIGDHRIRYYRNEHNIGPSASRNRGAALAEGSLLAFQDSDDEWRPDKLQILMEAMRQTEGDVAVVYHEMQEADGEKALIPSKEIPLAKKTGDIFEYMLLYPLIGIPASLIKKSCFDECGGFCEKLKSLEDYEFFLRLAENYRILFVEEPLIKIYDTPGSVNKWYKDKIDTELYILDTRYESIRAYGLLQKKIELIRIQAENYDCEDYFYEQILKLCEKISDEEKKNGIRQCTRNAATTLGRSVAGDRAAYYQNSAGQLERLIASLSRLQTNLKQNPAALTQNRANICQALGEVLTDVKGYTDLAVHPQKERLLFEELEHRLAKEQNLPRSIIGILDEILKESERLLGQIEEAGLVCTACGNVVRFLPPSPYRRVMRNYYGYRENGVKFLFEEGEKDRCPVCGATQELRFLLGFLADVQPEGDEKLKVLCMDGDKEENLTLAEGVRRYAAQREDMEYVEADARADVRGGIKADVVICTNVLEQADSEAETFKEIKGLLADNGLCVLMVSALVDEEEPKAGQTDGEADRGRKEETDSWGIFGLEKIRRQYKESDLIAKCGENGFVAFTEDQNWFGDGYYKQCGFGACAKLFVLTKKL